MKSLAVFGLLFVAMFAIVTPGAEARIGPSGAQYDRQAMIEEAYFAVTGIVGSHPTTQTLSQWNYMTYDIPAQNIIINRIGSGNAGWTTPIDNNGYVSNGYYQNIGRGGQCLFFVNLLLYRSEADRRAAYGDNCNYCWYNIDSIESHSVAIDSTRPKAGDIVFRPRSHEVRHIAVVVARSGNDVWIVESNYLGALGGEVASLRQTTTGWLTQNYYRVYTDTSYYNN